MEHVAACVEPGHIITVFSSLIVCALATAKKGVTFSNIWGESSKCGDSLPSKCVDPFKGSLLVVRTSLNN